MRFSVMTFNVRGSFHEDGANAWDQRRTLNLATIRHQNADIIGFQEVQSGNRCDYDAFLTNFESERGPLAIRQTERFHLVPVYWKRARFSRLDGGGFYLSPTPTTWSLGWGATLVRAATWVRLRERATGSQVVILNTHFAHEPGDDLAREESARLIIGQLTRIGNGAVPLIRTQDRLDRADRELRHLFHEIEHFYRTVRLNDALIGLRNAIQTARIVLYSARRNPVSRGAHYRADAAPTGEPTGLAR